MHFRGGLFYPVSKALGNGSHQFHYLSDQWPVP